MLKRILTVLVLVPVVGWAIFHPLAFKGLVGICLVVAFLEFFKLANFTPREKKAGLLLGVGHGLFLLFGSLGAGLLLESSALLMALFFYYLLFHGDLETLVRRLGLMLLAFCYIGTLLPLVGRLRDFPNGTFWILILLAMTWLNDTFAYFTGHWWGRSKLAPQVSPGKTWEGFWGGMVGSYVGFFLIGHFFPVSGVGYLLPACCGLVGPLGDLSESLLKRSFGVKDSGHIIPGHGGILDRIDALLFTAPVVYGFALFLS